MAMAADGIHLRALVAIVAVFLALVIVHIWWGSDEDQADGDERLPLSRIHVADDGSVEIVPDAGLTQGDLEALMADRARLLKEGDQSERRATALELATMAEDPAGRDLFFQLPPAVGQSLQDALLESLSDSDPLVVRNCRRTLVGLWRTFASGAAAQRFADGVRAYAASDMDAALAAFRDAESLGGSCPPDLYRMMAEAALGKSPPDLEEALSASEKALEVEPRHFLALCTKCRALAGLGRRGEALSCVEEALTICPSLPEARKLRDELSSRGA